MYGRVTFATAESQKLEHLRAPTSQLLPSSEIGGSQGSQELSGHRRAVELEDSLPDKAVAAADLVKGQTCHESGQI